MSSKYEVLNFDFSNKASFLPFLANLQAQLLILRGLSLQERLGFAATCHTTKEGAIKNINFRF